MFEKEELIGEMGKLRSFALRLTKNPQNAEDLLQSTLLRALEKSDHFQNGTNLFSWTSKLMFNIFVSGYRQRKKFETQYDPAPYIDRLSVLPSQEACVDLATVREGMKRLTDEHREILVIICINGMSYEEASKKLSIPIGTIRSRLSRARDQLQDVLSPRPAARAATACHLGS